MSSQINAIVTGWIIRTCDNQSSTSWIKLCCMKMSIRYIFIDLNSIHRKLPSDYGLTVSRAVFSKLMVSHFLNANKLSIFERSITCPFYFSCIQCETEFSRQLRSLLKEDC